MKTHVDDGASDADAAGSAALAATARCGVDGQRVLRAVSEAVNFRRLTNTRL